MEPPKPEDDIVKYKAWIEKNASALNAIGLSCELDIFSQIKKINSAKVVWDTLAKRYGQPSQGVLNSVGEQGNSSNISGTKEDKPSGAAAKKTTDRNSSNNPGRGDEKSHDYVKYAALLNLVRSGNLDALKDFLRLHPEATSAKITFIDQTALHIAVLAGHEHIVEELVERMSDDNLAIQDIDGYTALARATTTGNYRMVECMIKKNQKLVSIAESSWGSIPVVISMNFDYKELAHYLYSLTPQHDLEPEKGHHGASLVSFAIYTLALDIAVDLIRRCPQLAFALDREQFSPLYVLASTSEAFLSGKHLVFWKRWVYSCMHVRPASRATHETRVNIQNIQGETITTSGFKKLREMKLIHIQSHELLSRMCEKISTLNEEARSNGGVYAAIFRAIKEGNFEFVYEIVRANPDLLYVIEYPAKRTIFMLALLHRQAKIFSLIYGLPQRKIALSGFDATYNNTLHMAGIFTTSTPIHHIPGAALQMQRELQWFKEVESLVPPMLKKGLNNDCLTPRQLFTRDHEDLMKKGEEWIKSTATSCTVVGALIVTIMFAAAFTVPGVSVPVNLFVLMQFPLLVDMTKSTYGPSIFNKKMKGWI
ncbi:hypothetical protein CJ030_MR1G020807 [Morella rubra]|uniref:PGG domain-containing protein n=1 Tax=Morella rubra TaxID=262757 RepID=A0A6A1WJY5_9ROSI|nr:hypothetical protein CJ030_MR1G020807 [Morella rubra]